MDEYTQAAVLRLDRVVADPNAGRVAGNRHTGGNTTTTSVDAAERHQVPLDDRPACADRRDLGVPAMAPDRIASLLRVARGLVAASVHDLEVIDVPIGLVEVAVVVVVVAVPLVERLEVLGDLLHRLARIELRLYPECHGVADQEPGVGADDTAAEVAAIPGFVERDPDPLGELAVDRIAARGLRLVVLRHAIEVHVLVVRLVVVRLPQGRVVQRAVRLGDAVVQRAVEGEGVAGGTPGAISSG